MSTEAQPQPRQRSSAERIARAVLRVENTEPRALMPMKGSLVLSAIRCVITYVLIPALAPLISGINVLATPLSLLLSAVAGVMAVVSLRRVWMADWSGKWGYTAFAVVVLVLIVVVMAFDVGRLLA
ncbi:hypothetical protein [Egicoccus halophilus]|uniref:Uncharacterized protein n=1 Tax=Egicoccus halophilus TaxID=1670830 RepID=A0A8J3AGV2_9ACTN|nr:hypothetical protein [Egicoccus halophilus]GGI09277.1 hypothetical protein GCM10011354_33280 [Egicoccus halophilus]